MLLAFGWLAIVATSPPMNEDTLAATLHVPGAALKDGDVVLIVAENDAAASAPGSAQPLTVEVAASVPQRDVDAGMAPSASLTLDSGQHLPMRRGDPREEGFERFVISWRPAACSGACIHTAHLSVDPQRLRSPEMTWDVTASIVYGAGEEETPKGSGLVVGLRRPGSPDLLTSNTVPGVLPAHGVLLTAERPQAHQTLEMEIPRDAIPVGAVKGDTAEVVWWGGAFRTLAASTNAAARVVLTRQGLDPVSVPVNGGAGVVDGTSSVGFEVPFVMACDADRCAAGLQADFALLEGSWFVLDWSNTTSGVGTTEGDVWIPGWHLHETTQ
jgi:hypothetical protein